MKSSHALLRDIDRFIDELEPFLESRGVSDRPPPSSAIDVLRPTFRGTWVLSRELRARCNRIVERILGMRAKRGKPLMSPFSADELLMETINAMLVPKEAPIGACFTARKASAIADLAT